MMNLHRLILCAIGGCFFVSQLIAAVEWQVIKINGRDFLTVDNIAKFYGFPNPTIDGKNVDLNNGKNEMQFHIDSREMLINGVRNWRSEEHTSELQSHSDLVCRLLLEKKKKKKIQNIKQKKKNIQDIT